NWVQRMILGRLKTYREVQPVRRNDPEGGVGYNIRFFTSSVELGRKIAAALNAEGIGCGQFLWPAECAIRGPDAPPDWHVYRYMFPLILQGAPTETLCPFECPVYRERGGQINYRPDDCPTAADLFDRNIMIWLESWYNDEDCQAIAAGINKVLDAYCTEDPSAPGWV
ncbi:MAG TPA: hypothetical protein PLQ00_12080, partial [Thermoguttaceae bacterium]|nr:hypothetical protein [Thermoguttaceae bacterium]